MRKLKKFTLILSLAMAIFSCGQRGPLYLPTEPAEETKPEKPQNSSILSIVKGHFSSGLL